MSLFIDERNGHLHALKYLLEGKLLESCNENNITIEENNNISLHENVSILLMESFIFEFNGNTSNFTPEQCIPRVFRVTNVHGLPITVNLQTIPVDATQEMYEIQASQVITAIERTIMKINNEYETQDLNFVYEPFEITLVENHHAIDAHISFKYKVYIQQ